MAVPQKSLRPTGCGECNPALCELSELGAGLLRRAHMEPETAAMVPDPLLFLPQCFRVHLCEGRYRLTVCVGLRDEFPRAFTLDEASRPAFLTRRGQETAGQIPECTFACIIGPGEGGQIIGMKQAGVITTRDVTDGGVEQTASKFPLRNWGDKPTVWNRCKPL